MTPEQFCYWLQGRAELMPDTPPSADEWKMIAEHLKTVFVKVTPPLGGIQKVGPNHQIIPHFPPAPMPQYDPFKQANRSDFPPNVAIC